MHNDDNGNSNTGSFERPERQGKWYHSHEVYIPNQKEQQRLESSGEQVWIL
jgi:hypothetical protein